MDKKIILQTPGYLMKLESKIGGCWKITYETYENVDPKIIYEFSLLKDKPSYITINSHIIDPEDIIDLPPLRAKDEDQKTKSQRLRGVLYVMWEKNNENFKTSEQHYDYYMEKFINHIKSKIED